VRGQAFGRAITQPPHQVLIIIAPFAVDQPQRAVEQETPETIAFDRRLGLSKARAALLLEIVRQHFELAPIGMALKVGCDRLSDEHVSVAPPGQAARSTI